MAEQEYRCLHWRFDKKKNLKKSTVNLDLNAEPVGCRELRNKNEELMPEC